MSDLKTDLAEALLPLTRDLGNLGIAIDSVTSRLHVQYREIVEIGVRLHALEQGPSALAVDELREDLTALHARLSDIDDRLKLVEKNWQ